MYLYYVIEPGLIYNTSDAYMLVPEDSGGEGIVYIVYCYILYILYYIVYWARCMVRRDVRRTSDACKCNMSQRDLPTTTIFILLQGSAGEEEKL